MFTGLRSRLVLSFAGLLLVCLCIMTLTFTLLFFGWVSLPELAYARLADAAGPVAEHVRVLWQQGTRLPDGIADLRETARERGMRFFLVAMPGGRVVADTEEEWTGKPIRQLVPVSAPDKVLRPRGRLRGPDHKTLFYVAIPVRTSRDNPARALYLVLTMTWWEAARPFIGSLLTAVVLSGGVAFSLSTPLALWLAHSLSRPLQHTASAAKRVAAGDYSVSLDITSPDEARILAQSFNAMTRAVADAQRSQRDFVANVSHELKTPLTSIRGFAQAIMDGTANDEASIRRAATVIHDEADRLSRMVRELLDLARLESGQVAMRWNRLDLAALVSTCADRFVPTAESKGVRLEVDLPEPTYVVGDGDRLMQVMTNLVDNALKHTDAGGRVSLSLEVEGEDAPVTIVVADTGRGIPKEDLPRIFERFYQVDKSRSRRAASDRSGVGLGLAIVREIVRAHGGHVEVESVVGLGTRFTVTLPRRPPAAPEDAGGD